MLYRKLMSALFALSLLLTVSTAEGRAAPLDVRRQQPSRAKAKRLNSKKKKVNHNSKHTTASAVDGTWGGEHIRLVVTGGGADIEYDCAHGKIEEPFAPDADGHFDVRGTHVRESPGPIRVGLAPAVQPARYTGSVQGRTMTLTVTLTNQNAPLGTFILTRGSEGIIHKCR